MPGAERSAGSVPPPDLGGRDLWAIALLTLICLLLYAVRLGSVGFFDADEPAFAETSREMLLSGDWVTPTFNFAPRFDKPILFYWLIALAYALFGVGEFAARIWSAAFATLLVLSIYLFGRLALEPRGALLGGLAGAVNVGTATLGRAAVTDMTLTAFVTWTLFSFFLALHLSGTRPWHRRLALVGHLAMALAVLTKGPIGLLIPSAVVLIYVTIRGRLRAGLAALCPWSGLVVFGAVALPWYLLVFWINGWDFVQGFFVKHHLIRYAGVIAGHRGPVYYYIPVLAVAFYPWVGFLPEALRRLWNARSRLQDALAPKEELLLFGWLWAGVVVIFFSFSGTKLPSYVYPAFPALALLAGVAGEALLDAGPDAEQGWRWCEWAVGGIGGGLAILLVLSPWLLRSLRLRPAPEGLLDALGLAPYLVAALLALPPLLAARIRRKRQGTVAVVALAASMAAVLLVGVHRVAPAIYDHLQAPLRGFAEFARRELGPADRFVAYDLNAPSLVVYGWRPLVTVPRGQEARLQELAASGGRLLIVARASSERSLRTVQAIFPLDRRGDYVLYSTRDRRAGPGG